MLAKKYDLTCIVSGGARGADTLAERYASERGIKMLVIKPDWDRHGKSAGLIRNRDIIAQADVVIAFWDGDSPGTKYAIDYSKKLGKKLYVVSTKGLETNYI